MVNKNTFCIKRLLLHWTPLRKKIYTSTVWEENHFEKRAISLSGYRRGRGPGQSRREPLRLQAIATLTVRPSIRRQFTTTKLQNGSHKKIRKTGITLSILRAALSTSYAWAIYLCQAEKSEAQGTYVTRERLNQCRTPEMWPLKWGYRMIQIGFASAVKDSGLKKVQNQPSSVSSISKTQRYTVKTNPCLSWSHTCNQITLLPFYLPVRKTGSISLYVSFQLWF